MSANKVHEAHNIVELSHQLNITYQLTTSESTGQLQLHGPIDVFQLRRQEHTSLIIPPGWRAFVRKQGINQRIGRSQNEKVPEENVNGDCLMSYIPTEVLDNLDECIIERLQSLNDEISMKTSDELRDTRFHDDLDTLATIGSLYIDDNTSTRSTDMDVDLDNILHVVNEDKAVNVLPDHVALLVIQKFQEDLKRNQKRNWENVTPNELGHMISSANNIDNYLTKTEILQLLAEINKGGRVKSAFHSSMKKHQLVNIASLVCGDGSEMQATCRKQTPRTLRSLCKDIFSRKLSKMATNVIIATNDFYKRDLPNWREAAAFKDGTLIEPCNITYDWYAQPERRNDTNDSEKYIFALLDCHHIFGNARSTVCSKGISGFGINKQAWVDVAQESKTNGTKLSLATVVDLIDKQSNSLAQQTFSEPVEKEMEKLGWVNEAQFCRVIRNWYRAEDEAGLSALERFQHRMSMRSYLLKNAGLGMFPPPGRNIRNMPVVMFEGILLNIDRRTQLFSIARGGCYNARALGSLDSETFFSGFQDLDPNGSGVLRADDVPKAMETASYLLNAYLDSNR